MNNKKWLLWSNEIQSIAQNGLTFTKNAFDIERYHQLMKLATVITEQYSDCSFEEISQLFGKESGYLTPKLDVRGAIFEDKQILLVKEFTDGLWSLPGGYAEVNQSPKECVIREIHEETGFETEVVKFVGLFDKLKHDHPPQKPHSYQSYFICEITGGKATPSIETLEVEFFPLDKLPPLSLHRVTQAHIDKCYSYYLDPSQDSYCD